MVDLTDIFDSVADEVHEERCGYEYEIISIKCAIIADSFNHFVSQVFRGVLVQPVFVLAV